MDPMKLTMFVTTVNAIRKRNSLVKTASVFQSFGNAILTMIVEMILTNLHIFVATKTVPAGGEGVLDMPTTDVSPSGCSATAKMIAVTHPMNWMRIVPLVKKREISDAETDDAFPKDGFATLKMIAETTRTKVMRLARDGTENVPNRNSDATMTSVFRDVGNVTMMMIAATDPMKICAETTPVQLANSNVIRVIASKKN